MIDFLIIVLMFVGLITLIFKAYLIALDIKEKRNKQYEEDIKRIEKILQKNQTK